MRSQAMPLSALLLLSLLCLGCSQSANQPAVAADTAPAQPNHTPSSPSADPMQTEPAAEVLTFELPANHVFGAEVKLGDFRVRAVNRYWAGPATSVLTFEQALDQGLCVIHETGVSSSVVAEVKGSRPVLLLTGDLLIGGRQDRLVARSLMLEPGTTVVPVFCAEVSRWTAADGKYQHTFQRNRNSPQVDLNVKAAVYQHGTQSAIWAAISQVTGKLEAPDPHGTGSYRTAFDTPRAVSSIESMVARARSIVCTFTVGFAVYRNAELIAADLFDSTLLLAQVADKLLRAYAMTAVYGDVANWKIELPAPPIEAPTPPQEDPPSQYEPPPKPLGEFQHDGTLRFECRRTPQTGAIHTGIFRGRPKP